jgi:hypothetical protein
MSYKLIPRNVEQGARRSSLKNPLSVCTYHFKDIINMLHKLILRDTEQGARRSSLKSPLPVCSVHHLKDIIMSYELILRNIKQGARRSSLKSPPGGYQTNVKLSEQLEQDQLLKQDQLKAEPEPRVHFDLEGAWDWNPDMVKSRYAHMTALNNLHMRTYLIYTYVRFHLEAAWDWNLDMIKSRYTHLS